MLKPCLSKEPNSGGRRALFGLSPRFIAAAECALSLFRRRKKQIVFEKTEIRITVEDDVIEQRDADDFRRFYERLRRFDIFSARCAAARRMIVAYDHRRCIFDERFRKDFARMDDRSIDRTDAYDAYLYDFVSAVERYAQKMLFRHHRIIFYKGHDIFRLRDDRMQVRVPSASEFERGRYGEAFSRSHAFDRQKIRHDIFVVRFVQCFHDAAREAAHGRFFCAASEYEHDKFLIARI